MKVLNFGSVNIDHVYAVERFVRPGETLSSRRYQVFAGGKGFNQSVALTRAGAQVAHAGKIGRDGTWLANQLKENGVDTSFLSVVDQPTGHAVIQVTPDGENAIIVYPGANHCVTQRDIDDIVSSFSPGDCLLVQNETNAVAELLRAGAERGLLVVFNPAPMTAEVNGNPLDLVDLFILNETEAHALTNETEPDKVRAAMCRQFPRSAIVLTLGSQGAAFFDAHIELFQPARNVQAIDTTAAGDTFIGFFLAEYHRSGDAQTALALGCRAAAICVTRPGAANSIPHLIELGTGSDC